MLFLRASQAELPRGVHLSRPDGKAPQVRRVEPASKSKMVHFVRITHRDEVEAPITDWLAEAYELSDVLAVRANKPQLRNALAANAHIKNKHQKNKQETRRLGEFFLRT